MNARLHALATITPNIRHCIQQQPANRPHASIVRELTITNYWCFRASNPVSGLSIRNVLLNRMLP